MDTKTFGDCIKILLWVTVKTKVNIFKEGTREQNRREECMGVNRICNI